MSRYGRTTPRRHTVDGGGLYGSGNIRDLIDFSDSDRTEQANNTTTFRNNFNTGVYDTVHEEESKTTASSQSLQQQGGYVIPSSYMMISQTSLRDTGILRHSQNSNAASNSVRSYDMSSGNSAAAGAVVSSRNSAAPQSQRRLSIDGSCTSGISFQSRASSVSSRSGAAQQQRRLSVERSNSSGMPSKKSSGIYGTPNRRRSSISTTGTSCESRADSHVDEYGRTSFYSDTTASSSVASSFQAVGAPGNNLTRTLPKAMSSRNSVAQGSRRLSIESSNLGLSSQSRGTPSRQSNNNKSSAQGSRNSAVQGRRLSVDSNSSGRMSYQSRSSKQSHQATTSKLSVGRRLTVDNSDVSMSSLGNGTPSYQQLYNSVRTGGGTSGANQESGQYPYQIDFNVMNQGQSIPGSKRAIHIRFGFASAIALSRGMTGLDCRGEEHDIMAAWSITGGKRAVLMDGKEIQYSVGKRSNAYRRADVFEASWRMADHVYQLKLYAYPPTTGSPEKRDPKWRQYSLIIDGKSYFDLPFVHDLGHTAYCNLNLPSLSVHCNDSVTISGFTTGSSTTGTTNITKEDIRARINKQRSLISARKNEESHNKCKNRSPTPPSVETSATSGTSSSSNGTMGLENMAIDGAVSNTAHSSVLFSELDHSGYSADVDNRTLHQSNTSKSLKNEEVSIMPSPGVNKFAFF